MLWFYLPDHSLYYSPTRSTLKFLIVRGGGKLHFSEILHTHFHLLTLPLIMYFMQKVTPPILLVTPTILEKQWQICPEHNNL